MKIKLNEKEYDLHYSLRIYMLYENVSNHSLDTTLLKLEDLILLFYCTVIATLQYNKAEIIPYLEFLDYLDDNDGEQLLVEFSQWFYDKVETQTKLSQEQPKQSAQAKKN